MAAVSAYVGLGGNVGDTQAVLQRALVAIEQLPQTCLMGCSNFYRSAAWGPIAQPDYINAVAKIETSLAPMALMEALLNIEQAAGRVRRERWGPRILDLDLLVYGDQEIDCAHLQLPHPRMHERPFVLFPLAELAPALSIPRRGRVEDLCRLVDHSSIQALG